MELSKITKQNILKTIYVYSDGSTATKKTNGKSIKVNTNPKVFNKQPLKNNKVFHILFEFNNVKYYSCMFNQMLEYFNYNLKSFDNIHICENNWLHFTTEFGNYITGEFLIID
jgi:hypothetical protein